MLKTESLYIVLSEKYCTKQCLYISNDMSTIQIIGVLNKRMYLA
jgi:hypothetical protein